jgi:very-short-patch-repair endonuclease
VIVRAGLPEPPERNAPVTTASGRLLGRADLVYREQRIAIEYDGDGHRSSRRQWQGEVRRYESFADAGWRVNRVTSDDLVSPRILLARLSSQLGRPSLQ